MVLLKRISVKLGSQGLDAYKTYLTMPGNVLKVIQLVVATLGGLSRVLGEAVVVLEVTHERPHHLLVAANQVAVSVRPLQMNGFFVGRVDDLIVEFEVAAHQGVGRCFLLLHFE